MEFEVTFSGGLRVDARAGRHVIRTDQPIPAGGEDSAPAPFVLFLGSIATCAGIYVLQFCRQRGIPADGIRVVQRVEHKPSTGMIGKVTLEIQVPPEFPERYHAALVKTANLCAVKKHLENPPEFETYTRVVEG